MNKVIVLVFLIEYIACIYVFLIFYWFNEVVLLSSEVRVEGLETLDYLDNLKNRERFTEQGDAIVFESEVRICFLKKCQLFFRVLPASIHTSILCYLVLFFSMKVDKVYLSTPTKIAILDHERKRTFELRKDGLPDAGEWNFVCMHILVIGC